MELAFFHLVTSGPKYMLPSTVGFDKHDIRIIRDPAYSISGRTFDKKKVEISPGPKYYVEGFTEKGPHHAPFAVLASRHLPKEVGSTIPGPNKYYPNISREARYKSSPEWPLSGKLPKSSSHNLIPGPKYFLPSTIGHSVPDKSCAPAWSLGLRTHFNSALDPSTCSPGPGRYGATKLCTVVQKSPNPVLISGFKSKLNADGIKPGPKYYGNISVITREAPAFSFGVRHSWKERILRTQEDNGEFYGL